MLRVTAGHPYFLQLLCHTLVNMARCRWRTRIQRRAVFSASF
jgi:hypothetical protein